MNFLLTKLLPLILYPLGTTVLLLTVALLLLWLGRRRLAGSIILVSLAYLWAVSTPVVGEALLYQLEKRHPPVAVNTVPRAQTAIVMGGVVGYLAPPRQAPDMTGNGDRLVHAARLYKAGRVSSIIVSGGNYPWGPDSASDAEQMADLLNGWGIPRSAIHLEEAALNTRQNATNSKALMTDKGITSALLVTSGFHMPRALAVFQKIGLDPIPVSSGVHVVDRTYQVPLDYLPQAHGLRYTTMAIKEMLGLAVYRLRSWI